MNRHYLILALAAALISSSVFCTGQNDPDVDQGMHPYASYHGGDIDSVSLSNGNVILHLPLVSYSQRGKLALSFSLTYSAKAWQIHQWTVNNTIYQQWILGGGTGVTPIWDQNVRYSHKAGQQSVDIVNVSSADGSRHPMGALISGSGVAYESLDGTGYELTQLTSGTVIDRKGSSYFTDSNQNLQITDANGNKITQSSTGITDSVGRFFPASNGNSYSFLGISITPDSHCPGATYEYQWNIPSPTGTSTIYFCYASYTLEMLAYQAVETSIQSQVNMLHKVVLPDGTSWVFDYDSSSNGDGSGPGDLIKITFPTGGTISYTWANGAPICGGEQPPSPPISRWVTSRTVNDGTASHKWSYTFSKPIMTVTDPDGNDTTHTFTGLNNTCSFFETQTQYYTGTSPSRTLLKTANTTYGSPSTIENPYDGYSSNAPNSINVFPTSVSTTWPDGKVSQVQSTPDTGTLFEIKEIGPPTYTLIYGQTVQKKELDFGGILTRQSATSYMWQSNSTYQNNNVLDLVTSAVTQDGSGNTCAETDYGYDDPSRIFSSGVTEQHGSPPGAVRGNVSSIARWVSTGSNPNPCLAAGQGTKVYSYVNTYDTGMTYQSIDPLANATTYQYSGSFYGAYVTETDYPNTSSPNPASHGIKGNYDLNSGLLTSFTDQNNRTSSYSYDNMFRLTGATFPDGGSTSFIYHSPTLLERTQNIDGSRSTDTYVEFDGVGRETRRETANDESSTWDEVDTCYDGRGLKGFVSYPYQNPQGFNSSPICSGVGDAFTYDGLRRVTQVTHSDGSAVVTSYGGASGGAATSVTDEGSGSGYIQRVSQVDGLGRLTSVCEVTSKTLSVGISGSTAPGACGLDIAATGFLTNYTYDALGDLLIVTQGPLNQRSFGYDSLSRLVKATNPESGTTTYSYGGGTPCSGDMSSVCSRTDANSKTTTYAYDQLNRLRTKTYSDSTPKVTINYDEGAAFAVTLSNTTGRKSSEYTGTTATTGSVFSYDNIGRILNNSQCTPQNCGTSTFPVAYTYDYVGDQTSASNGEGITLTYAYNRAQRLTGLTSSLSDANHPATLLSGAHYNAFGMMSTAPLGNSLTEVRTATARGWLQSLSVNIPDPSKNTPSAAAVTISGSEQSTVIPAVPGTGTVTITGTDQYTCEKIQPVPQNDLVGPSCPSGYQALWDVGTVTVTVNGRPETVSYPPRSTDATIASNLATAFNNDANAVVNGSANGGVLTLTARTGGTNTDYSLSASTTWDTTDFPSPSFTPTPSGPNLTGGANAYTLYDAGTVQLTVNGSDTKTVSYGQTSTTSSVASAIASAFTGDSLVTAAANGATVTLTSIAKGQGVNYALAYASHTNDGQYFSSPSFSDSGPGAMSGGTNGYDVVYSVNMGYAPDGDVTSGNDSVNGNWAYTYDDFDRLATATQSGQGCAYVYDRFGNRWQQNVTAGTCPSPQFTFDANNHFNSGGYTYDAAGNLTYDGVHHYSYDAENRISQVDPGGAGATATYVYDADGRRVRKTTSSGTVDFIYELAGHVVSQVSSSGGWTRGEIFVGTRHFGTYIGGTGGSTLFAHTDWLTTERVRTNTAGSISETFISLPFGDALSQIGSSPHHLTGQERDAESTLDYFGARYYGATSGRFMTADWSAKPSAVPFAAFNYPQSLNLYVLTRNNPVSHADMDGHCYPLCTVLGGAAVGALIGGGAEMLAEKAQGKSIDWTKVKGSAVKGAITGAAIGAAGPGAGVVATMALGAGGNAVGGIADRAIRGGSAQDVLSPTKIGTDAAIGAIGGALGPKLEAGGEWVAQNSAKVAEVTGDQAAANFYSNNAAAIGAAVSKGADFGESTAESYSDDSDKKGQVLQEQIKAPDPSCSNEPCGPGGPPEVYNPQ